MANELRGGGPPGMANELRGGEPSGKRAQRWQTAKHFCRSPGMANELRGGGPPGMANEPRGGGPPANDLRQTSSEVADHRQTTSRQTTSEVADRPANDPEVEDHHKKDKEKTV